MSGNFRKWNTFRESSDGNLYVVLFISRNKDNKDVKDFKERKKGFISSKSIEELKQDFLTFCNKGVDSELCRFYMSVNARDRIKINKELTHYLIDNLEIYTEDIPQMITRIAARKENALEKKWLFDFDSKDDSRCLDFCNKIKEIDSNIITTVTKTLNGFHIVTNHGFDTRELLKEFPEVTLHKDDLILVQYFKKENKGDFYAK